MKWLRVGWAGILRHRLEAPIRDMWACQHPVGTKKRAEKLRRPFSSIVQTLKDTGYILHDDASIILKEYNRLSEILHGRT